MASKPLYNPRTKNLIVLSVKIRTTDETIDYLFPLNPSSLTINQASRVSATFTYGDKVFQNLGAGLKTLSIEGHTGYRLDYGKYGSQGFTSDLASGAEDLDVRSSPQQGKKHWLDLYAIIQLIKGENKFIKKYIASVTDSFSIDNIDNIEWVKITIPDQGITYDVLLQNDSFMRNREQPHLYKYKLDFIVTQESLGIPDRLRRLAEENIADPGTYVSTIASAAQLLTDIKSQFMGFPGIQTISKAYDDAIGYVNESVSLGNFFITSANSAINDLRRLERMTEALDGVTRNLSLVRGIVTQIQTFDDLKTAFYEPYIRLKNISTQMALLKESMTGDKEDLSFKVSLTQLASVSAPITVAANKATVAQFQKDIRQLNRTAFPFPIDRVQEITTDGETKINIFFKSSPSSLGISDVKIFAANDFGNENNLVESMSDSSLVMSTSYSETGFIYNFNIEYNYQTFESIVQPRYRSIKRVVIENGDTIDSIIKRHSPKEANASRSYIAEVAYLNNIEYPYVVTRDNSNYEAYFGSYGYKIFLTNSEFMQYIYNIDIDAFPGPDFTLYDSSIASTTEFVLQQEEVIEQIQEYDSFFVVLFKETYSSRCYALFGMTNNATCSLFEADSYVLCALEKGHSPDVSNNTLFEILSPYTITSDLIEYYGQTAFADSIVTDEDTDLFDKDVQIINRIYIENIGDFTDGDYPFTTFDHDVVDQPLEYDRFTTQKTFLAGDEDNSNYVILTNFTASGSASISSYSIAAFSKYRVLTNGQEILLPSLEESFLPFAEAFIKEDTYKVDLDVRFKYFDDINVSILPQSHLGEGQGILDFKLISGIDNVKQAIKNRLECPQGGLILHRNYGLPVLLGKKNTLEHLILLRYNLFTQIMSDPRVRSMDDIQITSEADTVRAQAAVVLVNNDNVLIKTTL